MLVPGMRHRLAVPSLLGPTIAAAAAILVGVGAWGFISTRSNISVQAPVTQDLEDYSHITSVAYVVPGERQDIIYIRSRETGAEPEQLISFPSAFTLHARGSASPQGTTLGVVTISGNSAARASLTFVTVPEREITVAGAAFDYLTALSWSPDGAYVAGQRSSLPDPAGRVDVDIIRAEVATGTVATLATFSEVLLASPVGYSPNGSRLFVITIDQAGSWLWSTSAGSAPEKVARLSTGSTRDWKLSPDGTRLAFIEAPVGDRSYSGRVLVLATGNVHSSAPAGEQLGASWRPGSVVPDFGGPGGSLQLEQPSSEGSYVVPLQWSPDGEVLIATVLIPGDDPAEPPEESIEIVTASSRSLLAEAPGAKFIGWVTNE